MREWVSISFTPDHEVNPSVSFDNVTDLLINDLTLHHIVYNQICRIYDEIDEIDENCISVKAAAKDILKKYMASCNSLYTPLDLFDKRNRYEYRHEEED